MWTSQDSYHKIILCTEKVPNTRPIYEVHPKREGENKNTLYLAESGYERLLLIKAADITSHIRPNNRRSIHSTVQ